MQFIVQRPARMCGKVPIAVGSVVRGVRAGVGDGVGVEDTRRLGGEGPVDDGRDVTQAGGRQRRGEAGGGVDGLHPRGDEVEAEAPQGEGEAVLRRQACARGMGGGTAQAFPGVAPHVG